MKQTFDTDSILYGILNVTQVTSVISGKVYAGDRPDNSELEDITINTIDLTQEFEPQLGTSNVNVHVADLTATIGGKQQRKEDRSRLKAISTMVLSALRSAKVEGLSLTISGQTTIREAEINQHYVNLRINWFIH